MDDQTFARRVVDAGLVDAGQVAEARKLQDAMKQIGETESLPLVMVRFGMLTPRQVRPLFSETKTTE